MKNSMKFFRMDSNDTDFSTLKDMIKVYKFYLMGQLSTSFTTGDRTLDIFIYDNF